MPLIPIFKHSTTLSHKDKIRIRNLTNFMAKMHEAGAKWVKGSVIAAHLKIDTIELRLLVKQIRMHYEATMPWDAYLIASGKGYALSTNKAEIKKYVEHIHKNAINSLQIVNNANRVVKKMKKTKRFRKVKNDK